MAKIVYIQRPQIDVAKWNACIAAASNSLMYGYTFYLDAMCSNWGGIIVNDYEAVFPLPWRRKWAISYAYQPFAIAQLGVFGNGVTEELVHEVLKKIPSRFLYLDFPLNFGNPVSLPSQHIYKRENYVLDIEAPYQKIYATYRLQLKRNIKKASARGCIIKKDIPVETVIALVQKHAANKASSTDFKRFVKLYNLLFVKGWAASYGVVSQTGETLAAATFFFANGRAYYILAGNSATGRTAGASHYLIDAFIKEYAGQKMLLDFEGSDVTNLQFFYSSFGAINEPYPAIRHNRLPLFLKWLK